MELIFSNAIKSLREQPAPYTIMALLVALSFFSYRYFQGDMYRLLSLVVCVFSVVTLFYLLVRGPSKISTFSSDGGHALSDHLVNLENVCESLAREKDKNHPLLLMLGGFMIQFSEEISKNSLELDPKYYFSCFTNLKELGSSNIYAIADLNERLENWDSSHPTLWKGVKERIFHIAWEDMYNGSLEKLISVVQADEKEIVSRGCNIYLTTTRESDSFEGKHPMVEFEVIGNHLLIIGGALVGCYIRRPTGDKLYLQAASEALIKSSEDYYNRVKSFSMQLSVDSSAKDVRKKWSGEHGIGLWNPNWNGIQERDDCYVDEYDRHILCWIPEYSLVLDRCADAIKGEVVRYGAKDKKQVSILELGCGTGSLTRKVYSILEDLDNGSMDSVAVRYQATDQSVKMLKVAKDKFQSIDSNKRSYRPSFDQLSYDTESKNVQNIKYDIISGSLILHFFIGKDWDLKKIQKIIKKIKSSWLSSGGCIIFADIFFTEKSRDKEEDFWIKHMNSSGMSDEFVNIFMENNKDMFDSPSCEVILKAIKGCDFDVEIISSPTRLNPFNIVKIQ